MDNKITIHERHMQYIDAVNNADDSMKPLRLAELSAFRDGLFVAGANLGHYLIEADMEQLDRGNDRDMCCGVFL